MADKQLLHLVMGGRVVDPQGTQFQDLKDLHVVGFYPNYAEAEDAWRAWAQRTVDDASDPGPSELSFLQPAAQGLRSAGLKLRAPKGNR